MFLISFRLFTFLFLLALGLAANLEEALIYVYFIEAFLRYRAN